MIVLTRPQKRHHPQGCDRSVMVRNRSGAFLSPVCRVSGKAQRHCVPLFGALGKLVGGGVGEDGGIGDAKCGDVFEVQNFHFGYGNAGKPSSFKNALCFAVTVWIALSISTSPAFVSSRSISTSPTAVLM